MRIYVLSFLQKEFSNTDAFYNVRTKLEVKFSCTHNVLNTFISRERLKRCVSEGGNRIWRHTQKKYSCSIGGIAYYLIM